MDENTKNKILDFIIYGGLVYIIGFYTLKGLGLIYTPLIVVWSPAIMAGIITLSAVHRILKEFYLLHGLPKKVTRIEKEQIHMRKDIDCMRYDFKLMKKDTRIIRRDLDYVMTKV